MDCQWTVAPQRSRGYERMPNPLRNPKARTHVAPPIAAAEVFDKTPPVLEGFTWNKLQDIELITALDSTRDRDGWHTVLGDPALVQINARSLRFPQPRFDVSDFPFRSSFAFLPDIVHEHGAWWQLEKYDRYTEPEYEGRKTFGFPVTILVCIFHRMKPDAQVRRKENITRTVSTEGGSSGSRDVAPAFHKIRFKS
jgi:hypothetical protein